MSLVISLNSNTCKFINKYYALLHKTSIKIHLSQKHSMHNRSYVQTFSSKHYPISKKMKYALHNLNKSKGIYYIVGDFNINLLNSNNNTVIKSYSNMIYSQGCLPIITQPTRITENSSALIDHVYTNNTTKEMKSFILLHDLTDHMPIIVSTNLKNLN